MAESSILGGDAPAIVPPGHDIDSLGPSDSSDSGSDVQGERVDAGADPASEGAVPAYRHSDSDAAGTGERGAATGADGDSPDIRPDRLTNVAGGDLLDGGLDDPDRVDLDELAQDSGDDPSEVEEAGDNDEL